MLPEAFRRILDTQYVCVEGDMAHLDSLSIPQLNAHFKRTIERLGRESRIFPRIRPNRFYIVPGPRADNEDEELVLGSLFINFAIVITPLGQLKRRVQTLGIPFHDKEASARELELQYEREIKMAHTQLDRFKRYLQGVQDPQEVSKNVLFSLHEKIARKKNVYNLRLQHSTAEGHSKTLARIIRDLDTRLASIRKIIQSKGP